MRIVSFVVAVMLILTGGGCSVMWMAEDFSRTSKEMMALFAAFGLLPLIGGALLLRYAWRDSGGDGRRDD